MKDIDFDSIGKKLKEIRTHKGFTQMVMVDIGLQISVGHLH